MKKSLIYKMSLISIRKKLGGYGSNILIGSIEIYAVITKL